jgi:type I restriction enzyme S subunit
MSEWREYRLEDLCSLITDGKHGDCQNEVDSGYYFLSVKDISDNRLMYENARQITELDFLETHRRTNLEPEDILFTNTGTIGRMAIVPDDPKTSRTTFQKSVAILKPRREIVTPKFLYYLLKFDNIRLSELAAGTTQKNLLLRDFRSFTVQIPSSQTQKTIASILSSLDDKIELNRRMNETLEAMARAIFKDWFVDFGPTRAKQEGRAAYLPESLWSLFPGAIDGSTGLPQGWEERTLGEVSTKITKGTTPRKADYLPVSNLDELVNFLRVNALSDNGSIIWDKLEKIPESVHLGSLKRSILEENDILYTIAGTIGRVAIVDEAILPANTNQAIAIIRPNSEAIPYLFLYLLISDNSFQERLHSKIVHAVQANLSLSVLSGTYAVFPPKETIFRLFASVEHLLLKVQHNNQESRTLADLRDRLLPKLMSGEIRVKDAEKIAEELD